MATGGRDDNSEKDASAVAGSEAVFDHNCQPCSDDGKIREAVGICVDCEGWLCKPAGKCTEKCDQHSGKMLKYHCHHYDFLGCSSCVIEGHESCKVDNIPVVNEITDTKIEFQTVTANLEAVAKTSVDIRNDVNEKTELVKTNTKESLKNVAMVCGYIGKESLAMKTRLEQLQNTGQQSKVCVALESKCMLATMEDDQKDAKHSSSVTKYTFKPNLAVEATIAGPEEICTLREQDSGTNKPNMATGATITCPEGIGKLIEQQPRKNIDYSKLQARHVADIPIKLSEEISCAITGSTLLSPDKLVLTDHVNYQVKVVDTNTQTMISNYKVDGTPWCVCKASDTSAVVTVCHKPNLIILSVSAKGNISFLKTLPVNGDCRGVAVMNDKVVVTYVRPGKMEIMDTSGAILKTINDRKLLYNPIYIALSPVRKSVYVSNWLNNTLTRVSRGGKRIATYKNSEMWGPNQIAIDSNGMIYVGCFYTRNVLLLTPDCKKVILDMSDGLVNVYAVSYCDKTDRLYIGMGADFIKVFQMYEV